MNEFDTKDLETATVKLLATLLHGQRNRLSGLSLEAVDLREQAAAEGLAVDTSRLDAQVREWGDELKVVRERIEPSDPQLAAVPAAAFFGRWREGLAKRLAEPVFNAAGDETGPQDLAVQVDVGDTILSVDATQLMAALDALLVNALEGGRAGAEVSIRAEPTEGGVAVAIANTVEARPVGIRRWGRLLGLTTKRGHLGLGCRFARLVAEGHGGSCGWVYQNASRQIVAALWLPRAV